MKHLGPPTFAVSWQSIFSKFRCEDFKRHIRPVPTTGIGLGPAGHREIPTGRSPPGDPLLSEYNYAIILTEGNLSHFLKHGVSDDQRVLL